MWKRNIVTLCLISLCKIIYFGGLGMWITNLKRIPIDRSKYSWAKGSSYSWVCLCPFCLLLKLAFEWGFLLLILLNLPSILHTGLPCLTPPYPRRLIQGEEGLLAPALSLGLQSPEQCLLLRFAKRLTLSLSSRLDSSVTLEDDGQGWCLCPYSSHEETEAESAGRRLALASLTLGKVLGLNSLLHSHTRHLKFLICL